MNIQPALWLLLGISLPSLAFTPTQTMPNPAATDSDSAPYIVFGAIETGQDREVPDTTVRLFSRSQPQTQFCWQAGRLNSDQATITAEEIFTTPKGGQFLSNDVHISHSNADGTRHSITSPLTLPDDPDSIYRKCWVFDAKWDPVGIYQLTVTIGTKPPVTRSVVFEVAQ